MQKLTTIQNITVYLLLILLILNLSVSGISNSSLSACVLKILSSVILLSIFFIHLKQNNESLKLFLKSKSFTNLLKILVIIILYPAVTIIYSSNRLYGTEKLINIIVSIIPNIIVVFYLFNNYNKLQYKSHLINIIAAGFTLSLLSIILLQPFDHSTVYQFAPLRWSHVFIGRTVSFITLVLFFFFLNSNDIKKIFAYSLVFIIGFSITYLTGLRTAIFGLIIFSFAGIIWQIFRKEITANHLYGFMLIIICSIILITFTPEQFETETRFDNLLQIENLEFSGDPTILNRMECYKLGWQMFKERPIFGWGLGSFKGFNNIKWTTIQKYPHNIILEFLSETGIVGCLLFLFLCYQIIRKIFVNKSLLQNKNLSFRFFLFLIFLFTLLMAMFSKDISSQSFLWLYVIFL